MNGSLLIYFNKQIQRFLVCVDLYRRAIRKNNGIFDRGVINNAIAISYNDFMIRISEIKICEERWVVYDL